MVQWLGLALSKRPNRVGVSLPSPEDGNRSSFRNIFLYLEFWTMDKVQKPSSEPFRFYDCWCPLETVHIQFYIIYLTFSIDVPLSLYSVPVRSFLHLLLFPLIFFLLALIPLLFWVICLFYLKINVKWSYPCERPWRPIGSWDVEDPTLSRQLAHS
jgi:hypothetical protein